MVVAGKDTFFVWEVSVCIPTSQKKSVREGSEIQRGFLLGAG
jgi:hypothetical protein